MPHLDLRLEGGETAWPDLFEKKGSGDLITLPDTHPLCIAALARGAAHGKTAAFLRMDLPDGKTVIFKTSLACLKAAVLTIEGRHGK